MCFVFLFSRYLTVPLLTEWLQIEDYVRFDSALCNLTHRDVLFGFTKAYPVKFSRLLNAIRCAEQKSFSIFVWLYMRGLKMKYFARRMKLVNSFLEVLAQDDTDVHGEMSEQESELFLMITQRVRYLCMDHCVFCNLDLLSLFVAHCSGLQELELTVSCCVDTVVQSVAENCLKLTVLRLSKSVVASVNLMSVCRQCSELRTLFASVDHYSNPLLAAIPVYCRQLVSLELRFPFTFGGDTEPLHLRHLTILACHVRSRLRHFELIEGARSVFRETPKGGYLAVALWRLEPTLHNVCIGQNLAPTGILTSLDSCFPNVRTLSLHLTGPLPAHVIAGRARVHTLHLTGIGNISLLLDGLLRSFPLLTSLHIDNLKRSPLSSIATACPRLTDLSIVASDMTNNDSYPILSFCRELTSLSVGFNSGLTHVSDHLRILDCTSLLSLDLAGLPLDNARLIALSEVVTQLHTLSVAKCNALEDAALLAVSTNCPHLADLNVSSCTKLTDAFVANVMQHSTRLRVLHISYCSGITNAGVDRLIYSFPPLRKLVSMLFVGQEAQWEGENVNLQLVAPLDSL